MQVGRKGRVSNGRKDLVQRHGGGNSKAKRRRSAARSEKAIETKARREGKEACQNKGEAL